MLRKIEAGGARPSRQLAELIVARLGIPSSERPSFIQWARTGLREVQPQDAQAEEHSRADTSAASVPGRNQAHRATIHGADTRDKDSTSRQITNPYKGLRPFDEADADDFFGRETLTARLLGRMIEEAEMARFLAVVGPSGKW